MVHVPVLLNEVIAALGPKSDENFVDCTFGWGGHSLAILEKTAPAGKILGIERDAQSLAEIPEMIKKNPRLIIVNGSYDNIAAIARENNFDNVSGVLMDLGMSSWQLDASKKGFSFSKDEPLDMRYDQSQELTAAAIINDFGAKEIEDIFKNYGQERFAKKIARAIEKERRRYRVETSGQLAALVKSLTPPPQRIKSLARIFQALRIAVNDEIQIVRRGVVAAFEILRPGGRIAVISFHSLEDKIIKEEFARLVKSGRAEYIVKKPITAQEGEIAANPRARSAKLRAIMKL